MSRSPTAYWRHIIPHLAAAGCLWACIALGLWQQDRASYKAELLDQWASAPFIQNPTLPQIQQTEAFSQVQLTGQFDRERHILLDNQTRNNHPGVHVFAPFRLAVDGGIVFVNLGWQPFLRHTGQSPSYPLPEGETLIQGRLSPPPSVGLQLGEASPLDPDQWPNLMTYFDLTRIKAVFGPEVSDYVLLLEPSHSAHLTGEAWPRLNMGPDRHRAYAFQWFFMAGVIVLIWASLSYRFYWRHHE